MEERVFFYSDGFKLAGVLHVPDSRTPDERLPAFMVLHGFGGTKNGGVPLAVTLMLEKMGYAVLRFDMRGCGDSEGPRARVICLEQVEDTKNALTWLATRPQIDSRRIAVLGHSFGAAVAVYAAGVDPRIAACVSSGGWGDGEKKFRKQHESPAAWKKFSDMVAAGRKHLEQTGEAMMVPRFDIVPIAPELRSKIAQGSQFEFPFDVVESMLAFRANDVVGQIAPRPLLLVHPSVDTVTPTEQSIDLFAHAGQPTDLHLVAETDHFILADNNKLANQILRNWLEQHFPQRPSAA